MWGGKIEFKTPMLFCVAFLFQFLVAGLTGIMLGSAPFNWQLGYSYFVVAHFHYVIVGAILFTIFGAFYYWFPKMSGRMYSETLGKLHFWLFLIGFHLTFDFMHIPGLLGMPRRIYTYEPGRGWDVWNLIVTIGVFFQAAGVLVLIGNLLWSYLRGRLAGSDPWDAWTLEWSTTSPPPMYNFAAITDAKSRRTLWLLTFALGAIFLAGTGREWWHLIYDEGLTIRTNLFGTTYYSLVGLHAFHVTFGLLALATVSLFALLGHVRQEHAARVDVMSLYWHFVD